MIDIKMNGKAGYVYSRSYICLYQTLEYVDDFGTILFQLSEGLGLNTRGVADKSIS